MRGLYMAEAAMLVQQARLSLIGNNLANIHTAGYKRDEAVQVSFGEIMLYRLQGNRGALYPAAIGSMAHSVAVQESRTSFAAGPLQFTGRSFDLAVTGQGFFQVQIADGIFYTRNGRFLIDADGFLVTAQRHRILGEGGPLFIGTGQAEIQADGSIYDGENYLGRLQLVTFAEDAVAVKAGDSYFRLEGGNAVLDDESQVWSGFLEGSNTDLVREMTAMIQVRRSYEAAQKVMITYDAMLQKAANELGSLG